MLNKLMAFLCLAAFMTATAQDRLGLLEIQKPTVKLGTYWERVDFDGRHLDDYHWGTAYLVVGLETGKWNGLSIGAELFAHSELYDSDDDMYDVDIEPQDKVSLSKIYLQYEWNKLLVRAGRIGRKIGGRDVHLDDNIYEGLMAKFDVTKDIAVVAGAITSFAEIDYDDAEGMTRIHNYNNGDAADAVGFVEAYADVAKIYTGNAFAYYHDDYATMIGLDNKVTFGDADSMRFGGILNANYIDSKVGGLTPLDDSINAEIAVFAKMKLAGGELTVQAGHVNLDGDGNNPALIKPNWSKDYMVHCDQTQLEHSQDLQNGMVNYVWAKAEHDLLGKPCWARVYLGRIDYEDGNFDQHLELMELWLGCDITKKLNFFIKLINVEHKTHVKELYRVETRLEYTF